MSNRSQTDHQSLPGSRDSQRASWDAKQKRAEMGVERECGDSIDSQWREIDDFSDCLSPGESDDLPGEISGNSDGRSLGSTDFHKTGIDGVGKSQEIRR